MPYIPRRMADHQPVFIENVPSALWRRLKVLAAMEGTTLRALVLSILEAHVKRAHKRSGV